MTAKGSPEPRLARRGEAHVRSFLQKHALQDIISVLAYGGPDLAVRAAVQTPLDGPSKGSLRTGLALRQGTGVAGVR